MSTEHLEKLFEKSRDGVAIGRSLLQMIGKEIQESKNDLTSEELEQLEYLLEKANDYSETTERSLSENERCMISKINGEDIEALKLRIEEEKSHFRTHCLELEGVEETIRKERENHRISYKEEEEKLLQSIREQEAMISDLELRVLELETVGWQGDTTEGNVMPPRMVVQPPSPRRDAIHFADRCQYDLLSAPVRMEGDSRESGISEGSSPNDECPLRQSL